MGLVDVGGRYIFQGADFLEPLDMSLIPNAKALDPGWVTPKGIFTSTGATIIAWNTKAFPADKGPTSWKDFWDVKAFPGPRGLYKQFYYNYEAALLAAGTARKDIYPVSDDKVKLAIEKLTELKPHVKVWWTAGATAATAGERRACHVFGLVRPHPRRHQGERGDRHDLQGRHRLGQCLGRGQGDTAQAVGDGGDQLRDLTRSADEAA